MPLIPSTENKLIQLVADAAKAWNVLKDAAKTAAQRQHAATRLSGLATEISEFSSAAAGELLDEANAEIGL